MVWRTSAWRTIAGLFALSLCFQSPARAQEDKVLRTLTTDQLEAMLKKWNIDYQKVNDKVEGVFFYDHKKNNTSIRLYYFNGKDLMLDALFGGLPLDVVNQWNRYAKFSRAVLDRNEKGNFTAIESNLNFAGGVTQETVKEFLNTFDDELAKFDKFLKSAGSRDVPKDEKIYKEVPSELLEKIMADLNFKVEKVALPRDSGFGYQILSKGLKLTLSNWGTDLMVAAQFPKISLERVNKYNLERKYIRVVAYQKGETEFTSLECNLDCTGGVSASILRHFISVFEDEVRDFGAYVEKALKEK